LSNVSVSLNEIALLHLRQDAESLATMLSEAEVQNSTKARRRIVSSLGTIANPRAVEVLIDVARDESDIQMRRIAMHALAKVGDRAFLALFTEAVASHDKALRIHAIHGLANTGANEAVKPLIRLLGDRKPGIRSAAARGLADLGDEAGLQPIRDAVRRARWHPFHRMGLNLELSKLEERTR
jgi:HEAT repeat protein